jgi:hypothetical protein
MASYYVWSGATGAANGTSWTNAYTTLTLAYSGKTAGDVFYVAHDHAETTATAITLTSTGTVANPNKIICASRSGSVPPVSADRRASATVSTTGASNININGFAHYDGIIFKAGSATSIAHIIIPSTGTGITMRFDNCSLQLNGTATSSRIYPGNAGTIGGALIELNNTTLSFSAVLQAVENTACVRWRNTPSALLGTIPTNLFLMVTAARGAFLECIGVDLSAAGSGKNIVGALSTATANSFRFVDCKLDAAVTKSTVPASAGSTEVDFIRCGASGIYPVQRHRISGLLTEETTIVRSTGASDSITPISWKVVTTANCTYSQPFECPPIATWNGTAGSPVTATIECIGAAVATTSEVWVEVEYINDATAPQGAFISDGTADLLTTAVNQTTSSASWGGSTAPFKLEVTFTPQQAGFVYARVKVGKASSTFYIDPLVTLT